MENVHTAIAWYQTKIGSYDKQLWEQSVEKKLQKQPRFVLHSAPRKKVHLKTEYIDVDLIRGSTFAKSKPQVPWVYITRKAISRVLFFPFYYNWWVHQTSKKLYKVLLVLYTLQVVTVLVYLSNFDSMEDELSFTEVILPVILMFLLCLIHSQTVLAHINHKPPKPKKSISGVTRKPHLKKVSRRARFSDSTCLEDDGNTEISRMSKERALNQHLSGVAKSTSSNGTSQKKLDSTMPSSIDMEGSLMSRSVSDYDLKPAISSSQNELPLSTSSLQRHKEVIKDNTHQTSDKYRDKNVTSKRQSSQPWGKEEINIYSVHGKWGDGADNSAQTFQKSGCSYNLLDNLPNLLTVEKVFQDVSDENRDEDKMVDSESCSENSQVTDVNLGHGNLNMHYKTKASCNDSADSQCCEKDISRSIGDNEELKSNLDFVNSSGTCDDITVFVVKDGAFDCISIPKNASVRDGESSVKTFTYHSDIDTCSNSGETSAKFKTIEVGSEIDSLRNLQLPMWDETSENPQDISVDHAENKQRQHCAVCEASTEYHNLTDNPSSLDFEMVDHHVLHETSFSDISGQKLPSTDLTTCCSTQSMRNNGKRQDLTQPSCLECETKFNNVRSKPKPSISQDLDSLGKNQLSYSTSGVENIDEFFLNSSGTNHSVEKDKQRKHSPLGKESHVLQELPCLYEANSSDPPTGKASVSLSCCKVCKTCGTPLSTSSSVTAQGPSAHLLHNHLQSQHQSNVSSQPDFHEKIRIHDGLDDEKNDLFEENLEQIHFSEGERHSDDISNYNPSDSDGDSDGSVNEDVCNRFEDNWKRLRFQEVTADSECAENAMTTIESKNIASAGIITKSGMSAAKTGTTLAKNGTTTNVCGSGSIVGILARKPSPLKDITIGRKLNSNTPVNSSVCNKEQSEAYNQLRRRKRTSGTTYEMAESNRNRGVPGTLGLRPPDAKMRQISSSENETCGVHTPEESNKATLSSEEWEDRIQSDETTSSAYSSNTEMDSEEKGEEDSEEKTEYTSSNFHVINLLQPQSGSPSSSSGNVTQPDRVSCMIWEGNECKKIDLTALDIGWAIIDKVDSLPESSDYFIIGLVFSFIICMVPLVFRVYANKDSTGTEDFLTWSGLVAKLVEVSTLVISSYSWRQYILMINGILQRFFLSLIFFFLLSVADRTFKQRLLYAKHFSYLTSCRRARKFSMPHFRLNKVRSIKIWLSLRSYLKRRGPQRSVDVIVSACFLFTLSIVCLISLQMLKDTASFLDYLCNWEFLVYCIALSVFLMRFMTLGLKINKKYRNLSVLITEQINLYLQMEQKPHKKEELILANNVLRLAEDLLKELESPFKISGFSANPLIYNIMRIVVLSAFSAVLTEVLGFKLKLHKIKLKG